MQLQMTCTTPKVAPPTANATYSQIESIFSMTDEPPRTRPESPIEAPGLPSISSEQLLGGQREIIIQHGAEQYRLRLTNNNKLILVK
jgi:hemin uptake protein HemP